MFDHCVLTKCLVSGFVPFLGYHHVLMILIAIAIILLCKLACRQTDRPSFTCHKNITSYWTYIQVSHTQRERELTPSLNLTALLLAGCSSSSPLIPDIFLLSLYYSDYTPHPDTAQVNYAVYSEVQSIASDARLQARVGYFGICVNPDGGSWLCSNNATALAQEVSVDQDPLNLIWLASQFKDMVVFPYLM